MDKRKLILKIAKGKTNEHAIVIVKDSGQGNNVEIERIPIEADTDLIVKLLSGECCPLADDE